MLLQIDENLVLYPQGYNEGLFLLSSYFVWEGYFIYFKHLCSFNGCSLIHLKK